MDEKSSTILSQSSEIDEEMDKNDKKDSKFSVFDILKITIAMSGVVFCWAVQIGYTTPFMRQLGLPRQFVSWVWIAGPLSGIIVQSIVGYISDHLFIPYLGRRRPWMVLGIILTSGSLILFSNSDWIGDVLFPGIDWIPIVIATITFFALDFSINSVQVSIRCLIVDMIPANQQTLGNICITLSTGLGNSIGFGIGSIPFISFFPFLGNQVRPTYFIGMNVLLFCVLVTCATVHETKYPLVQKQKTEEEEKKHSNHCGFFAAVLSVPSSFWRAYICQFLTYIGKFSLYIYMSDYVGKQIFNGDPNAAAGSDAYNRYANGVRFGSFGFLILSIVNVIYAPILNICTSFIPIKVMWFISQFLQGVSLLSCPFIYNKYVVLFVFAALGIVETTLNSIPWAIVNAGIKQSKAKDYKGLFQALFNTAQCLPQFLTAAFGFLFVLLFRKLKMPAGSVLAVGGVFGFSACIAVVFAGIPEELQEKRKKNWKRISRIVKEVIKKIKKKRNKPEYETIQTI